MGKNQRHKKDLKAEKAKIKFKQSKTKFLPKGLNVTNTTFKIKPIVLPEQLKENSTDDILSKRKLNVKDLLSRIRHYNENVRHSACEDLSDMIKYYTDEIVLQHLSQVCLAISSLMQDREKKVRKGAIKCIEAILENVPDEKLTPFFDYFSTNLRCAMTNIDKNIQEDSLFFLDCFIRINNRLITKCSERLLPDFLSLISKMRSDSQLGRTLTLNLGSKMTSVTWRIKVLSRLHVILSIILEKEVKGRERSKNSDDNSKSAFHVSEQNTFPIYNETFGSSLEVPSLDIFSTSEDKSYSGSDIVNRHIVTLVPLLYETWLEVRPEKNFPKSVSETSVLNEETAALLTCITNTLYLLWQYVKKIENDDLNLDTVFMTSEGQKFLKHLLYNFPYCHTGTKSQNKKRNGTVLILEQNNDPRCVHENLLVCFLFLVLFVNCKQYNLKKENGIIVSYLTKLFFQKKYLGENSLECILELLTECFGKNYQKWHRCQVDLNAILENVIFFYDHGKINDKDRTGLFQILADINNNVQLSRNPKFQSWLSNLPSILCQPSINDSTVLALLELSKKNCSLFHYALVQKLSEILENLEKLQIVVTSDSVLQNDKTAKRNLASIFFYIPTYSTGDFELLQHFANTTKSDFKKYFQEMLILRK